MSTTELSPLASAIGKHTGNLLAGLRDRTEQKARQNRTTSTGILADMQNAYQPSMDRLRDEANSTELVDHAEATADSRFNRGVQAASHIQAAQGGMTTRQQALANYQSTKGGAANRDARVNVARGQQQELQEGAREGLEGMERSLLAQQATQARHGETLDQQRKHHEQNLQLQKAQMNAQKKSKKKGFLGSLVGGVAGFALGGPVGAMAGSSIGGQI